MKTADIKVVSNIRIGELNLPDSFVASIAELGIIEPLVINEKNELITGHRRLAAAQQLGLAEVPVHVRESNGSVAVQVAENLHREGITNWETAQAVMQLKDEGLKHAEIATALSMKPAQISRLVKAGKLDLPDEMANQMSLDALVEIADAAKEAELEPTDIARPIVKGEARDVYSGVRAAKHEVEETEILDELAQLQSEWAELGITVTSGDRMPNATDEKDQWGYEKKDKNILRIVRDSYGAGIDIDLEKHIVLPCHQIHIEQSKGWGHTSWSHWCTDAKSHKPNGKSELKATNTRATSGGMSDEEKAQRREEREAKQQRRLQAATFLTTHRTNKADRYKWALQLANEANREETTRAVVLALIEVGEIEKRPKGAEHGWYGKKLDEYLIERFGPYDMDDTMPTEVREFLLLAQMAFEYIERPTWGKWNSVLEEIEPAEVADA